MRLWPLIALPAAGDLAQATFLVAEARAAQQDASRETAKGFLHFTAWCDRALDRRDAVHASSAAEEEALRQAELVQHGLEATSTAEIASYTKQQDEAERRQQDALAQMEADQAQFEQDSAGRAETNATLAAAVTTLRQRLGAAPALAAIRQLLTRREQSPGLDVVVGALKGLVDEVVLEEEREAAALTKRLEGYHDFLETNAKQLKGLEVAKRGYKFQAMFAKAKLVTFDHMWELISGLDDAEQRMSRDLRALCRAAATDSAAATAAYDRLDTRLAQLGTGIGDLQPSGRALWAAGRARHPALVRVAANGPADAAAVLRTLPGAGSAWKRLIQDVSARSAEPDRRLLTALDSALATRSSKETACSEVAQAAAAVSDASVEFDALFDTNTSATASLEGVQAKMDHVNGSIGRGDRRELAAALDEAAAAVAAAGASLNETATQVGEAGALVAEYAAETDSPAAQALEVSVDGVQGVCARMLAADALRETRTRNATLVATISTEYAVWEQQLAGMQAEEEALQAQLAELATQLEAATERWQAAREAHKSAEDSCEVQAVLWTRRTARATVERAVLAMATRALGPTGALRATR